MPTERRRCRLNALMTAMAGHSCRMATAACSYDVHDIEQQQSLSRPCVTSEALRCSCLLQSSSSSSSSPLVISIATGISSRRRRGSTS